MFWIGSRLIGAVLLFVARLPLYKQHRSLDHRSDGARPEASPHLLAGVRFGRGSLLLLGVGLAEGA